ncbi:hypothetical protein FFA01_04830 [Frigoribacterium faeni]|nr:hypothetical protein GCM10025699_64750 [Microbacterium flavescens]GEK82174.1 hypothetical protein FFA01_04830 [Frigoribacterium faeni]
MLPGAALARHSSDTLVDAGETGTGTVVEVMRTHDPGSRYGSGPTVYYPVTEQVLDGAESTKEWTAYKVRDETYWAVGDRVPLRFDPADPTHVVLDGEADRRIVERRAWTFGLELLVGTGFLLLGIGAEASRRRWLPSDADRRKTRAARRRGAERARRRARRRAERRAERPAQHGGGSVS